MKTRIKLVLLACVLLALALFIVACGGGEPAATTQAPATTAAPVASTAAATSTAPAASSAEPVSSVPPVVSTEPPVVTTTPPSELIHPDIAGKTLLVENQPYTGREISRGYGIQVGSKVRVTYTFLAVDPTTKLPLEGAEEISKPTEAGTYELTAMFRYATGASAADKEYKLPDPMTAYFVVLPAVIDADSVSYGAQGYNGIYFDGLAYQVADTADAVSPIATGNLTAGLVRTYKVEKVDDENGANPVAYEGTVISDPGYFKVTIGYAEAEGKNNFANEADVTHSAIVYFRDFSTSGSNNQVLKAEGITIDGVIDPAYFASAQISAVYDDPATVDPYENMAMPKIYVANKVEGEQKTGVTIYALWGEETYNNVTTPYVYLAIEVYDETYFPRAKEYTCQLNSWVNDSIELGYYFGGYEEPVIPKTHAQAYPTYNVVLADAREKTVADHGMFPNHTAVKMQKSIYFDQIQTATKRYAEKNTYVIEYKIPAKSESYDPDTYKAVGIGGIIDRFEGPALTPGEFIFLTVQHNDLTFLEPGADDQVPTGPMYIEDPTTGATTYSSPEWSAFDNKYAGYMSCWGNRNTKYLRDTEYGAPVMFQLSAKSYTVEINAADGVKDADYEKGIDLEYDTADVAETTVVRFDGKVYIYTTTTEAVAAVYTVGDVQFAVAADGTINPATAGITAVKAASGNGHEIVIDVAALANAAVSVQVGDAEAVE